MDIIYPNQISKPKYFYLDILSDVEGKHSAISNSAVKMNVVMESFGTLTHTFNSGSVS